MLKNRWLRHIRHPSPAVRARHCHRLDTHGLLLLVNDPDETVRTEVARYLDISELHQLAEDPSPSVQAIVYGRVYPKLRLVENFESLDEFGYKFRIQQLKFITPSPVDMTEFRVKILSSLDSVVAHRVFNATFGSNSIDYQMKLLQRLPPEYLIQFKNDDIIIKTIVAQLIPREYLVEMLESLPPLQGYFKEYSIIMEVVNQIFRRIRPEDVPNKFVEMYRMWLVNHIVSS